MITSRLVLLLAGLSLVGCGGEAPGFDEEGELDTTEQGVFNINHCAMGTTPNALFDFPGSNQDAYVRPRNRANPGGPCGSTPRQATYVEFTTSPSHVVSVIADANFVGTPNGFCGTNKLVFKVEKWVNGEFLFFHAVEIHGQWVDNVGCIASGNKVINGSDATGRYRVRAVAPRFDGLVEEVRIRADDIQD